VESKGSSGPTPKEQHAEGGSVASGPTPTELFIGAVQLDARRRSCSSRLARLASLDKLEGKASQDHVETMVSLLEIATQRVARATDMYEQAARDLVSATRLQAEFVEHVEMIAKRRRMGDDEHLAFQAARELFSREDLSTSEVCELILQTAKQQEHPDVAGVSHQATQTPQRTPTAVKSAAKGKAKEQEDVDVTGVAHQATQTP